MVAACRDLCAAMPGLFSVACACYRLRTAICHTLEILAVSRLLAQCRQLVGHFKHSNITSHALSEQQKQEGTQIPLYLVSQVAARWNSKYDMFDCLHKLRVPVTAVLSGASITEAVDQGLNLSPNQWVQVAMWALIWIPLRELSRASQTQPRSRCPQSFHWYLAWLRNATKMIPTLFSWPTNPRFSVRNCVPWALLRPQTWQHHPWAAIWWIIFFHGFSSYYVWTSWGQSLEWY